MINFSCECLICEHARKRLLDVMFSPKPLFILHNLANIRGCGFSLKKSIELNPKLIERVA